MVETGYNGFFDCVVKSVKENGFSSLFNGSIARVAWLLPFTAIYLPIYEIAKRRLMNWPVILPSLSQTKTALGVQGGSLNFKKQNWIMEGKQPIGFFNHKYIPSRLS